jgi:Glycosyltransferase family 87
VTRPPSTLTRRLALAAVLVCWAGLFVAAWIRTDGYQWDFKVYYHAVQAFQLGENPYDTPGFQYPLAVAYLFEPIASLDYGVAHRVWVVLKLAAVAGLLVLWKRAFLPRTDWWLVLLVSLLAFRAAGAVDVKAGNVSVFEQVFIWTGLAFFLKSRFNAFAACIVTAGICKLLPAAFLLLLLLPAVRSRANVARTAAAFATLGAVTLLPFLRHPRFLPAFVAGLHGEAPLLTSNPTPAAIWVDLASHLPRALAGSAWAEAALLGACYAVLIVPGRRLIARAWRTGPSPQSTLVFVVLYALLAPRMVLYSFMILVVPLIALVIPAVESMRLGRYAVVAAVCMGGLRILPAVGPFLDDLVPLLILWGCWAVLAGAERAGRLAPGT